MNADGPIGHVDSQVVALAHSWWRRRRLRAVEVLTSAPGAGAVPLLADLLRDRRSDVADAAADALLEHFGVAGRAALLDALTSDHEWARLAAARTLAYDREPRALDALAEALDGPDADQWGPALDRIVLFGAAARPIVERYVLDDGSGWLGEMCARTLPEVAGEDARPALMQAARSRNRYVAGAAKGSLAYLDSAADRQSGP